MAASVQVLWPDKLGEKTGFQNFLDVRIENKRLQS